MRKYCIQYASSRMSDRQSGFTIIELLVSMGLFSVLVSIAAGGFIQALRTQRQTLALFAANDAMSFTVEQMAREIRTGKNFSHPAEGILNFTNYEGQNVAYCLDAASSTLDRSVSGFSCAGATPITADSVRIRNLDFLLGPAGFPPRVTILFSVSPRSESGVKDVIFNLQTTVSGRNL